MRFMAFVLSISLVVLLGAQSTQPERTQPAERKEPSQPPRPGDKLVHVRMDTSMGSLLLELNETRAPITVKNFLAYVDKGFYDGTIIHRMERNFVVQGGGLQPDMTEKKTDPPIKNESGNGLKNMKYTLSMARTNDLNSATSQFFINLRWNTALDHEGGYGGYAVFGRVIEGMDVVDRMNNVRVTTKGRYSNVPAEEIVIRSVTRVTSTTESDDESPATAPATRPGS